MQFTLHMEKNFFCVGDLRRTMIEIWWHHVFDIVHCAFDEGLIHLPRYQHFSGQYSAERSSIVFRQPADDSRWLSQLVLVRGNVQLILWRPHLLEYGVQKHKVGTTPYDLSYQLVPITFINLGSFSLYDSQFLAEDEAALETLILIWISIGLQVSPNFLPFCHSRKHGMYGLTSNGMAIMLGKKSLLANTDPNWSMGV